eukprot:TRINITY_DN2422_c1_g1_i1.p1 TRINITY_DN2422_c1_g1~~TRINITY_DN2422_c1_g1_i1.p1  ORF type:complete len:449 (+),score=70.01 TRINITY_DN2422_c1_g1_i1:79-1347(+)
MREKRGRSHDAPGRKRHQKSHSPRSRRKSSRRSPSSSSSAATKGEPKRAETHYRGDTGDTLSDNRYKIVRQLGEGTFARVMECIDTKHNKKLAVKIIRAERKYMEGAEEEMGILKKLERKSSKEGRSSILSILNVFMEKRDEKAAKHTCIVFPLLGPSVFQVLESNQYRGYSNEMVRSMCFQLITACEFIHSLGIVHTDIKPENVVFKHRPMLEVPASQVASPKPPSDYDSSKTHLIPLSAEIVLIDFGSAYDPETSPESGKKRSNVGTRHYRPVEAVLNLPWGTPADVWSLGCMFVELSSGECMFQTHENLEHLAMMDQLLGPFPSRMVDDHRSLMRKRDQQPYVTRDCRSDWPLRHTRQSDIDFVKDLPSLSRQCENMYDYRTRQNDFLSLIRGLLRYDPEKRMTCKEALRHRFLKCTTF